MLSRQPYTHNRTPATTSISNNRNNTQKRKYPSHTAPPFDQTAKTDPGERKKIDKNKPNSFSFQPKGRQDRSRRTGQTPQDKQLPWVCRQDNVPPGLMERELGNRSSLRTARKTLEGQREDKGREKGRAGSGSGVGGRRCIDNIAFDAK